MSRKTPISLDTEVMSGSPEPACIKQEPETLVTDHSQCSDTDRPTLTELDTTKGATGRSPDLKTHFTAEVGLDKETEIKQERSWTEIKSAQADHDALTTTVVPSDVGQNSCTVGHDTESKESAGMSQYTTWHGVHNVGTEQFLCIKQEVYDTDFHQTAEHDRAQTAMPNQEQPSSGRLSPSPASILPADVQANNTQSDTSDRVSIKTERQEYTEDSLSDTDVEDKPSRVYPVGLYQNVHASDSKSNTSVNEQLCGETISTASAVGKLDTGECEMIQQNTGTSEKFAQKGVKRRSGQLPAITITATEKGPFICEQCWATFSSSNNLKDHMKSHIDNKPYVCEQCQAGFNRLNHLKRHMLLHAGDTPFVCNDCGAAFNKLTVLKRHMAGHISNKPIMCEQCGKHFASSRLLNSHMKNHTGDKPYMCEHCQAAFIHPSNLKQHMMIHTGDKPYVCKECGAAFNQTSNLKQHMMVHTGDKPFVCKQCGAAFSWSNCLKRHMLSHTGDKPYKCKQCGATFSHSSSLKRHTMIHTGEKPFVCNQCGTAFNQSSTLKQHMKTHRRNEKGDGVK